MISILKTIKNLKNNNFNIYPKGFTLVEILIVVSVLIIISASGVAILNSRVTQASLDATAKEAVELISQARNYAVTGYFGDAWGIRVLNNSSACVDSGDCIIMFKGEFFASRDIAYDRSIQLDKGVYIDASEANEFYFKPVAGWLSTSTGALMDQYLVLNNNAGENISILTSSNGLVTTWSCGDAVSADALSYGTVLAADGNCWLDRNIGATRVAQAFNDANAYGYLYQWGRASDGHQLSSSGITATLSATDIPGHADFITPGSTPFDWRSSQNNDLWQGVQGINNVCPSGFRLPTRAEWTTLLSVENITNSASAYSSALKLTVNGYRDRVAGIPAQQGVEANYWSSTVSGNDALVLWFTGATVGTDVDAGVRSYGMGVRCLKN